MGEQAMSVQEITIGTRGDELEVELFARTGFVRFAAERDVNLSVLDRPTREHGSASNASG